MSTEAQGPIRTAPIRIGMGMPPPLASGGGIGLPIGMLVEDLQRDGRFEVRCFGYGAWAMGEGKLVKVWHQLVDLVRYRRRLRALAPDLVHLNSSLDRRALLRDVPFALATRLGGKRLLVEWHGSQTELLATRALLWRGLVSALLRLAAVGVLSREEETQVRRRCPAESCYVVRNGVDLGRYARRPDLRRRHGVPAAAPLLLFISRLIPAKGLLDVLHALPEVAARHGAHLLVVGDGPTRQPAEALVQEFGLAPSVHFVGWVTEDEAVDYYCGSDVLVFPTYHPEGFPMTVFQSLAAGLGIVTTRVRATADYLRDPENCLFVPARDPAALTAALHRALGDAALLASMRRHNLELAQRFDRRLVAAEFGSIYDGILAARDATVPTRRRSAAI